MSEVLNDIDRLLQAAPVRILNPSNSRIILTPNALAFHLDATGVPSIDSITVTATLIGLDDAITFSAQGGALTDVTEKTATIHFSSLQGRLAIVTATVLSGGEEYKGNCIIPTLQDGSVGEAQYVWIKYADGPDGAGLSDLPDGKPYIGLAQNKTTATESTDPADYRWSLIKGTDGQPGGKGADGKTFYTWIKYSDNADGAGMYDLPTETTIYIGIAINKETATESTDNGDYTWSKFRGSDGVSVPGSRGAGFYRTSGDAWSDAAANAVTPGGNVIGDIVTISNGTSSYTKEWDGTTWFVPGAFLSGSLFVEKSIFATHVDTRGLSIYTPSGQLVLSAGVPLAQQARFSPNLVPNPRSWKYFSNGAGAYSGSLNTANGEYLHLPAIAGVNVMAETDFAVPAVGGTFTLSCLANSLNPGGDCVFDILGSSNFYVRPLFVGLTTSQQRFVATFDIPANTTALRLRFYTGSGKGAQAGDVKLEQGPVDTAWSDNVITESNARSRVYIPNLAALSAFFGKAQIGAGGAIWQGQEFYDTGLGFYLGADGNGNAVFSMATANGGKLLFNPAAGVFKLIKPEIEGLTVNSFSVSIPGGGISGGTGPRGERTYGTRAVSVSGNYQAPLSYQWSIIATDAANGNAHNIYFVSGTNGSSVTVGGTSYNFDDLLIAEILCTVTDGAGLSKTAIFGVSQSHGSGAA